MSHWLQNPHSFCWVTLPLPGSGACVDKSVLKRERQRGPVGGGSGRGWAGGDCTFSPNKHVWKRSSFEVTLLVNSIYSIGLPLVAQRLKHLPAMWETWVQSLGWEDPLEKEMATHSSFLAWRIPWTEQPGGLQSTGSKRVGHDWATSLHFTSSTL